MRINIIVREYSNILVECGEPINIGCIVLYYANGKTLSDILSYGNTVLRQK